MLNPLYNLVARGIVTFHDGLAPIFGENSFFSYALAIVLIVMLVRLLIVPLFVRSVKAQRTMQMLQPRIKEIREKYKNDKPRMNQEIMALQKEHGNPLLGCLPLLLQIPLFITLFHVFRSIAPRSDGHGGYVYHPTSGLSVTEVQHIAEAKIGGVTLAGAFTSPAKELAFLGANGAAIKVTCVILIIVMSATTFITQRQIMARSGPVDPQQQNIQRIFLYVSPLFLAIFGFNFPIAVLLYWLTTNAWSMGQQHFIIKKMPPILPAGSGGAAVSMAKKSGKAGKGAPVAPTPPPRLTQVRQTPPGKNGSPATNAPDNANSADSTTSPPNSAQSNGGASAKGGSANGAARPSKAGSGAARRPGGGPPRKRGKGSRRGGRR